MINTIHKKNLQVKKTSLIKKKKKRMTPLPLITSNFINDIKKALKKEAYLILKQKY